MAKTGKRQLDHKSLLKLHSYLLSVRDVEKGTDHWFYKHGHSDKSVSQHASSALDLNIGDISEKQVAAHRVEHHGRLKHESPANGQNLLSVIKRLDEIEAQREAFHDHQLTKLLQSVHQRIEDVDKAARNIGAARIEDIEQLSKRIATLENALNNVADASKQDNAAIRTLGSRVNSLEDVATSTPKTGEVSHKQSWQS